MASPNNDQASVLIHNPEELRFLNHFKSLCIDRQLDIFQLDKANRQAFYKRIEAFPASVQRDITRLLKTYDTFSEHSLKKLHIACTNGYYIYYLGKKISITLN